MSRPEALPSAASLSDVSLKRCEHLIPEGGLYRCDMVESPLVDISSTPFRHEKCPIADKSSPYCEVKEVVKVDYSANSNGRISV